MSGPCLSSSVADHPLRPATRLSLGEPLPRQQADRARAPPQAPLQALVPRPCGRGPHPVLIHLSAGYPGLGGRLLTCYSPVRRSHRDALPEGSAPTNPARLACLNHAASVHSEPGSNSPKENFQIVMDPSKFRTLRRLSRRQGRRGRPRNT